MLVIGAEIKSGEFKGFKYHNVVIHGTYPIKEQEGVGTKTGRENIRYTRVCEILDVQEVTDKELNGLIGKNLEFGFDRYGRVNYITEAPQETR